jgi:hypothetical protein
VREAGELGAETLEAPGRGASLAAFVEQTHVVEPSSAALRSSYQVRVQPEARPHMADNWTHDRPCRAPESRSKRRRHIEEQPMLELPLPDARQLPQEAEAQPAAPERGVAEIDFYV